MIGYLIDGFDSGAAFENPTYYSRFLLIYMGVYLFFMVNTVFTPEIRVYEKAARALTLYSIEHLNKLSLNWHERQGSGGKLQRVMTGRKGYQELSRHLRWDFFPLVGDLVAIGVSMWFMDIPLFYVPCYFLFVISYLAASWYFARPFLHLYDRFNVKFEGLLAGVYEFIGSIRTVKSFHLNDYIIEKAQRLEEEGQQAIMRTFYTNLFRWSFCNCIAAFWLFVFAWTGFQSVLSGSMTTGVFAATFFLAYRMWSSCESVGSIWEKVYEYGNGISRLVETLREEPKKLDLDPIQTLPKDWRKISLEDVSYVYADNDTHGIKNISFVVERGQKIAFVGSSGAGKSTLVKLLMKQMLPDSGSFKLDDVDVSHLKTSDWLGQIGFVPQDVELFNVSIRENILIDRDDCDDKVLNEVLKQSALDEFVADLPDGLETVIGERGIKLSGGQRQRLGIARALIRQAPIMIFDEATSSLDSISEGKIQGAIESSFDDRTVFVIAHRLSTVRNVDRIIVLDEGYIIEDGSFDELIKKDGHFSKLWSVQT
jgi:ATP-binding cassette subfamily B protein